MLLAAGALVVAVDIRRDTPLHCAAQHGHHLVIEVLLRAGADIDRAGYKRSAPLHRASSFAEHSESVKVLLGAGASVSAVDKEGWTALHHAASVDNAETIQLLMANVCDVSGNGDGRQAIHVAAVHGHDQR